MEGSPVVNYLLTFEDVPAESWYTEAVRWATAEGIILGYNNFQFGSDDSVTRQDMVALLYRYLQYKGGTPTGAKDLIGMVDADDVAGYATDAVRWAYGNGLVQGTTPTTLSPRDNTTRAQFATIILRYLDNVSK